MGIKTFLSMGSHFNFSGEVKKFFKLFKKLKPCTVDFILSSYTTHQTSGNRIMEQHQQEESGMEEMEVAEEVTLKQFVEQTEGTALTEEEALEQFQHHFATYAQSVMTLSKFVTKFPKKFSKPRVLGTIEGLLHSDEDNMKRINKLLLSVTKKKSVVAYTDQPITPALQAFLELELPVAIRPNVRDKMYEYIKTHQLRNEQSKKHFRLDETLATLFQEEVGKEFLLIQVNHLLSRHFIKNK